MHPVRDRSISTDGLTDEQVKTVDEPVPAPLNNYLASCMSAKCFELVRSNEHNSSASKASAGEAAPNARSWRRDRPDHVVVRLRHGAQGIDLEVQHHLGGSDPDDQRDR
jgi:hypothetical protein